MKSAKQNQNQLRHAKLKKKKVPFTWNHQWSCHCCI